jgi:hypothetical protein
MGYLPFSYVPSAHVGSHLPSMATSTNNLLTSSSTVATLPSGLISSNFDGSSSSSSTTTTTNGLRGDIPIRAAYQQQMKEMIKKSTIITIDGIIDIILKYLPRLGIFVTKAAQMSRYGYYHPYPPTFTHLQQQQQQQQQNRAEENDVYVEVEARIAFRLTNCFFCVYRIWLIDSPELPPRCVAIVVLYSRHSYSLSNDDDEYVCRTGTRISSWLS